MAHQFIRLSLIVDTDDVAHVGPRLRPAQLAALVRARLEDILSEEDDLELSTRLEVQR